jgi:hypothetical protein
MDLTENTQMDCEIHSVLLPLRRVTAVVNEICQYGDRTLDGIRIPVAIQRPVYKFHYFPDV